MAFTSNAMFMSPTSGTNLFVHVVMYDSAPFYSEITGGTLDYPAPSDDTTFVFKANEYCRAMRLVTISASGRNVQVEVEEFSNTAAGEDIKGKIDPVKLVNNATLTSRCHIESLSFSCVEAAGDYIYLSCIGKHIAVFSQARMKLIQEPRFSASYLPFYRKDAFNPLTPNTAPMLAVGGVGYLPKLGGNYPATLLIGVPQQNTPIVARPIQGDANTERGNFHAIVNALFYMSSRVVPSFSGTNTNVKATNVAFYRSPLIFY